MVTLKKKKSTKHSALKISEWCYLSPKRANTSLGQYIQSQKITEILLRAGFRIC